MLQEIPLDQIDPDPKQPRKHFDEAKLHELAASIRENGLLQPITVRPENGGSRYRITMGERRYRAHKLIGAETIAARVQDVDEKTAAVGAIIENLQRVDVTPIEEARAFKRMLDMGYTEEQLAAELGLSQPWRIRYRVRLLDLDERHQKLLTQGAITLNAAQEIARLPKEHQTTIIQRINKGALRNDQDVTAAVDVLRQGLSQSDIFGGHPSKKDRDTLKRMEGQIARIEKMTARNWKDGQCVIATKVSPDRAGTMAEKINLIRKHLRTMERQLREATVQVDMLRG